MRWRRPTGGVLCPADGADAYDAVYCDVPLSRHRGHAGRRAEDARSQWTRPIAATIVGWRMRTRLPTQNPFPAADAVPRFAMSRPGLSGPVVGVARRGPPARTATEDTTTDSGSVPRRLLIIDDDPACRTTVGWLLRKLGHTVAEAESGSAGLALLRQTPVDLVMTDLTMPGLTGWAVARLVKAMRPRLPVVLVTGDACAIPLDQPERAWVDAILAKPCRVAAMQAVIGALTRGRADAVGAGGQEGVPVADPTGKFAFR